MLVGSPKSRPKEIRIMDDLLRPAIVLAAIKICFARLLMLRDLQADHPVFMGPPDPIILDFLILIQKFKQITNETKSIETRTFS